MENRAAELSKLERIWIRAMEAHCRGLSIENIQFGAYMAKDAVTFADAIVDAFRERQVMGKFKDTTN